VGTVCRAFAAGLVVAGVLAAVPAWPAGDGPSPEAPGFPAPLSEEFVRGIFPVPDGVQVYSAECDGDVWPGAFTVAAGALASKFGPGAAVFLCDPVLRDERLARFVLAHEVGHVVLGHDATADLSVAVRQEVEADLYAAERTGPAEAAAGCRFLAGALAELRGAREGQVLGVILVRRLSAIAGWLAGHGADPAACRPRGLE
jgi:Zn-dependent protease with chaperone function